MSDERIIVLAHGGAGSNEDHKDGPQSACQKAVGMIRKGAPILYAACAAVETLENDGRFNAGIGSRRRSDGSIQMDAACMDSDGQFGSVAAVEGYRNPIHIAQGMTHLPYNTLAGRGAASFAFEAGVAPLEAGAGSPGDKVSDTVGCVAYNGTHFAAALSTGGTAESMPGRVGDVPMIGCGLYVGPYGAVCATGLGEAIALNMTAFRAYQMMEEGMGPNFALEEALGWFKDEEDIGLLLISRKDFAGGSNRSMAWAALEEPLTG